MKGHVWRPLYAVICLVVLVLAARYLYGAERLRHL